MQGNPVACNANMYVMKMEVVCLSETLCLPMVHTTSRPRTKTSSSVLKLREKIIEITMG
jgi:hypothetical protein